MPSIHHLSPELVAKIAAGEVIERPAYGVKELIENAIDAQASEIHIYLEEAGLKKIQVTDNGVGMDEKDLVQSYLPHTTSKITKEDDLVGIQSFGFRGEALSSLAAVSTLTIKSRTKKKALGYEIQIDRGSVVSSHPVGMPQGTTIIADNLFTAIPARKKFLKSTQTELRHTIDIVTHFSAAYPSIHFTLQHNKKILLDTPKTKNTIERLHVLMGENLDMFLPVKKEESYVKITGFLAKPQRTSTTQSKQFLFINNRKVSDKLLSLAVKEAFGTMLEPTAYPLFILFITVPFDMVDVNVHPRKEQVSFVNNQFIFQTVKEKIAEVLQENNITFQNLSWKRSGVGTTHSYAGKLLRKEVLEKAVLPVTDTTHLLQLHRMYIVVSTREGFLLVDQHAAHERILFEKLQKEFIQQKNKKPRFSLPKSIKLPLSPSELILLEEHTDLMRKVGFVFHVSQRQSPSITITEVPFLLHDRNPEKVLQEFLVDIADEKPLREVDRVSEEMLAFLACRSAVKAGDTLTENHMKEIVTQLEVTAHNATCPHGRPTTIQFLQMEIDTLFKRR